MPVENTANAPLSHQVAVVTGASRGIGAAISRRLASMGATVVLAARSGAGLTHLATEIRDLGGKCEPAACDVTNLAQVDALARAVDSKFGRLDILVNNAGIGNFDYPLHELPPDDWDRLLNTNLRGPYYMIRAFTPMMIRARSGHIINISSLAGKNPVPRGAAYSASKWGLNGLTYSLAEELRAYTIRVSVVCPGSTATEFSHSAGNSNSRILAADDIAHVIAMLVTQAPQSFISEVLVRPTQKPK